MYEKGGHFAPHRDSQRSATHFGTLVILLPGKATGAPWIAILARVSQTYHRCSLVGSSACIHYSPGGELILRHGGTEATFAIPGGKKKCTFVAYYADIEHEVKPVLKGRRISLLYNLHKPASSPAVCPPPSAPLAANNGSAAAGKHEASENLPPILSHVQTLKRKLQHISSSEVRSKIFLVFGFQKRKFKIYEFACLFLFPCPARRRRG